MPGKTINKAKSIMNPPAVPNELTKITVIESFKNLNKNNTNIKINKAAIKRILSNSAYEPPFSIW